MASQVEFLLGVLQDLGNEELKNFQWFLRQADIIEGFPAIPKSLLEQANRLDTVDQMVQTYGLPGAQQITVEVLKKISRNDLVELFCEPNKKVTGDGETYKDKDDSYSQEKAFPRPPISGAQTEDLLVQRPKPARCITIYQRKLQSNLVDKFMCIPEGSSQQKDKKHLDDIYTELYIIDSSDTDINRQHEVGYIQMKPSKPNQDEGSIRLNDIFNHPSGKNTPVRTVLTNGIAGIGKTFLVNKFILDWAERRANQDVHLTFPFTFRQLNLLKGRRFCLAELIHKCIRESRDIREEALNYIFTELQASGNTNYNKSKFKLLFVFDGLDESRLQLYFHQDKEYRVDEPLLVRELLASLIMGQLLPSARLWITTRPAAANQVPLDFVDIMTEVRGFTDPQKEEYFRKRFRDEQVANRIISHVKTSRSLHIMCHIPVFCWITATVLGQTLGEGEEIPQTLTEMYTKFLVFQMKQTAVKYDTSQNTHMIQSLGKLAFHQLKSGTLIFYEADLKNSGIDISEASVYSGVFTQIFKEDDGLKQCKMFSFVHLSIQEFLAAVFVVLSVFNDKKDVMAEPSTFLQRLCISVKKASATEVCMNAVDKALQRPNGHLDLFLRFLLGLSVKSNQDLLQGMLKETGSCTDTNIIAKYIKTKIRDNPSPERSINLFHCLSEMKDCALVDEIQHYLRTQSLSTATLSPTQWSALVFVLMSSETRPDVFDLKKYSKSEEVLKRMLPLVKAAKTALLDNCELSQMSCEVLASILCSPSSTVRVLDLSDNNLQDSGVSLISAALESPHCRLETLRFLSNDQPEACCHDVGQYCSLKELDLSDNELQDFGIYLLSAGLKSPHCRLETLRLSSCNLKSDSCELLASVLSIESSCLTTLDLSNNDLMNTGVYLLWNGLESRYCKLETLMLSNCLVTEKGCFFLGSTLRSNPCHLRELDLSCILLEDSGLKQLSDALEDPHCSLETLRLISNDQPEACCHDVGQYCSLKELDLSDNELQDTGILLLFAGLKSPHCRLETLRLSSCNLMGLSCLTLAWILSIRSSCLTTLDLSNNYLLDNGVDLLCSGLESRYCKLETLMLSNCLVTEKGCFSLGSTLRSNPCHLRELDLSCNLLGDLALKQLSAALEDPHCSLETLRVHHCGEFRILSGRRTSSSACPRRREGRASSI
ncbi:NACHT, LRR and PYD domains-containing protein 12-like isoform X2 [Antennarius striatus]|uniref:NACHT, LRR and PYD domains-containing protein 12-like isoform X2 n=1 Tax=Antennarius striatus TaxID=241820 RepID=UPI0035AEFEC1